MRRWSIEEWREELKTNVHGMAYLAPRAIAFLGRGTTEPTIDLRSKSKGDPLPYEPTAEDDFTAQTIRTHIRLRKLREEPPKTP